MTKEKWPVTCSSLSPNYSGYMLRQRGRVMCSSHERRRYNVTSPCIGWAHTHIDPWCTALNMADLLQGTYLSVCLLWCQTSLGDMPDVVTYTYVAFLCQLSKYICLYGTDSYFIIKWLRTCFSVNSEALWWQCSCCYFMLLCSRGYWMT